MASMGDYRECTRKNDNVEGHPSIGKSPNEGSRIIVDDLQPSLATTADSFLDASRSSLLLLPNELLDHVFAFLDAAPPSQRDFTQLPRGGWLDAHHAPLKALSTVSRRLRAIVLQRLFKHARLDPCHLTPFLEFVDRFDLASAIESMVAHVSVLHDCFHPAWYVRLLNQVPVSRLTVGSEPHVLAGVTGLRMNLADRWAFNIPYQYLELRQPAWEASRLVPYSYLPGLFVAKHWDSLKVNEGSSLAAYTSYEYFLKKPPSLMSNINTYLSTMPLDATPDILHETYPATSTQMASIQEVLQDLREFSYIAVFPFYNHVDDILKSVRRMKNLEEFFIKMCPDPGSTVLDDAVKAAEGHIDVNDPWAEWVSKPSLAYFQLC